MLFGVGWTRLPEDPVLSAAETNGVRSGCGAAAAAAVRLGAVSVVREGKPVLDGVDWVVGPGERWVVLGPNGSGKTTLLQVAGARLWPTAGEVEVLGERLGRVDVRALRPRVALVSGSVVRQLRPEITAREVVVTGRFGALEPWWHRYDERDWASADRLLDEAGVGGPDGIGHRPFGVISEGERQHVLLARALMSAPELLLLDEPAAGMSPSETAETVALLRTLRSTVTIVIVEHDMDVVFGLADRIMVLQDGHTIAFGTPEEIRADPRVREAYLGGLDE